MPLVVVSEPSKEWLDREQAQMKADRGRQVTQAEVIETLIKFMEDNRTEVTP